MFSSLSSRSFKFIAIAAIVIVLSGACSVMASSVASVRYTANATHTISPQPMVAACYRRMDINLSQCVQNKPYELFTLDRSSTNWTEYPGYNCYDANGAKVVPGPEPWPSDGSLISLSDCQKGCMSDTTCTAIVTGIYAPVPPPPPPGGIPFNPGEQIAGPGANKPVSEWFKSMQEWRVAARSPTWYTGKAFNDPQLKWTQTSYIQPQMHPYDRFFFDPTIGDMGNYTVQKWLDDVNGRYGGADAMLMWPTYTNIGADDRSQFDFFEAMPGGISGVRQAISELHAAGVKVLIPYNPWDAGTLRCGRGATCGGNENLTKETMKNPTYCNGPATAANPGVCDARIIDSLIAELDADGFNGDTMGIVPEEFYDVSVGLKHSVAIEPEGGGNVVDGSANWDTMGWGYWKYPYIPSVDSWKWQDSRRLTNVCERWSKNHTNALQYALFNGDGFESWENVWGTWNGITQRDAGQIRRVGSLLRFLGGRGYLQSQAWVPHFPTVISSNIFASYWPLKNDDGSAAWTIVNRALTMHTGPTLKNISAKEGFKYYDLYNGVEVVPNNKGILSLSIERFGAVLLQNSSKSDPELIAFLSKMASYARTKIADLDPTWHYEMGKRVPIARAEAPRSTSEMVKIPGGPLRFDVKGIEIEGGGTTGDPRSQSINPYGVDFQYEWESQPNRYHTQWVNLPEYYLDITPVTQGAFADYLSEDKSRVSADRYHFLKNWDWTNQESPKPFAGNETLPVTYVGIEEARAYCKAMGKRLPHEEEWQFAATGGGDSMQPYPWGYSPPGPTTTPRQISGTVFPGPEHVGKYPQGASPFGVLDMVGNVWQMTDEYQDTHTRSVIVKGGANYRPGSSLWYFPSTDGNCANGHCGMTTNDLHNKYFLMNSRYERCGTIGFRCAADVAGSDHLDCEGKSLCGKFEAPNASVVLLDADEWVLFDGATPTRSPKGKSISNVVSGSVSTSVSFCNGTQTTFTWGSGASAMGACVSKNTTHGLLFNVSATSNKPSTLSVYAGSTASAAMITATLIDGTNTTVFSSHVNATQPDIHLGIPYNLRWELKFTATSPTATVIVNISSPSLPITPPTPTPPSPSPPPCTSVMCGNVVAHTGDVVLSDVGTSDWTHYGLGDNISSVNRKCETPALIHKLKATGAIQGFNNCPQTFSWKMGGFESGTPRVAQVGDASSTPTGIYSFGKAPGGFVVSVDIPVVNVTTHVSLFIGTCGNQGVLSTTLFNPRGSVLSTYNYTMEAADSKTCQWTAIATISIPSSSSSLSSPPSSSSSATRTFTASWTQTDDNSKAGGRNVQLHGVAVDAGGVVEGGGGERVPCSHNGGGGGKAHTNGPIILQAAVLV